MDVRPFMLAGHTERMCRSYEIPTLELVFIVFYIRCFLSCDCNLFDDMNVRLRSLLCLSVSLGQKVYDQGEEDDDDD